MDPNAPSYPMQHNASYPVPPQGNPQQFAYYQNQMSFPQSNAPSQPIFGAVPLQPSGAMMPAGFPQQSPAPHGNFSTPFTQPPTTEAFPQPTTSTASTPTTKAHSFPQNTASVSAKNMASSQQQMPPQQAPSQNAPQSAQSPAASAREKERVSVLLEINSMLLQEAINLQSSGKAGGSPTQASQDANPSPISESNPDKNAQRSPEYVNCMRRLQANLAYLATVADKGKKAGGAVPPAPAIMTPPPNIPAIAALYTKLNELFPRAANAAQTGSQSQGNGGPSPSPTVENTV
ncbi:uncharacterized protein BJX67DRAFT_346974 [Aspergillus lucknowensis]|uniref:Uncharacterized protein n=1 Tax=Aspergillus lucknowensis TaxID=176173 RepID=A0ABR4M2F6_9EURO